MTLFWYILSKYWYVHIDTYLYQYVLNTLFLYERSRFKMSPDDPLSHPSLHGVLQPLR
jgi:hypothetical protein